MHQKTEERNRLNPENRLCDYRPLSGGLPDPHGISHFEPHPIQFLDMTMKAGCSRLREQAFTGKGKSTDSFIDMIANTHSLKVNVLDYLFCVEAHRNFLDIFHLTYVASHADISLHISFSCISNAHV